MSELIEALRAEGNDVEGALNRFMGSEDMYVKFLGKLVSDESYSNLMAALEAEDVEAGFIASHTLKGVLGNLGLTVALEANTPLVESMRGGKLPEAGDVEAFKAVFTKTMEILRA